MAWVPWKIRDPLRRAYGTLYFRDAMQKFLKTVSANEAPGAHLVRDLIYGWSNEYWSALEDYLLACIGHAFTTPGPILECGSGLSTIVVGAIAKQRGVAVWTLEHDSEWATRVKNHLDRYALDSVVVCTTPLRDYGSFAWYDPPLPSMPRDFALVVCDGPPAAGKGGRYGLAPVMNGNLKTGCIILLDDADRDDEREVARRWERDLRAKAEIRGRAKPYFEMSVRGAMLS